MSLNTEDILRNLNEVQAQAVTTEAQHALVLAGAGSGKTRVLVHRIAWLIAAEFVSPFSILAVTFTNKAAAEMRNRIAHMLKQDINNMWIGTFHGLAHRLLKAHWHEAGLPENAVQVVKTTDRAAVGELITMPEYVDVIVPRGGKGLIERVSKEAKVAVIKHLDGICHVFIDRDADQEKALNVAFNAKTHRYGTCNTMETLLVDEPIAEVILPALAAKYKDEGVELRGCESTQRILTSIKAATEEDWSTEYLAPVLSIKIVSNMAEAIEHINKYGSHHTDSIITENYTRGRVFITAVDSSSVMINASTRFADGFEYGLGAEIGISTDKIHARGPVGLDGLTSQKYVVFGDGHIRQ